MNLHRFKPSSAVAIAVVALVIGLEAPAMAHQVNVIAHEISGSSIKPHSIAGNRLKNNTVTGAQVKESTLAAVPDASKLGGKPAKDYVTTSTVSTTGAINIPNNDVLTHLVNVGPVSYSGECYATAGSTDFSLTITAVTNLIYTFPGFANGGHVLAAGASAKIYDQGISSADLPEQVTQPYAVMGTADNEISGTLTFQLGVDFRGCQVEITAQR